MTAKIREAMPKIAGTVGAGALAVLGIVALADWFYVIELLWALVLGVASACLAIVLLALRPHRTVNTSRERLAMFSFVPLLWGMASVGSFLMGRMAGVTSLEWGLLTDARFWEDVYYSIPPGAYTPPRFFGIFFLIGAWSIYVLGVSASAHRASRELSDTGAPGNQSTNGVSVEPETRSDGAQHPASVPTSSGEEVTDEEIERLIAVHAKEVGAAVGKAVGEEFDKEIEAMDRKKRQAQWGAVIGLAGILAAFGAWGLAAVVGLVGGGFLYWYQRNG